MQRSVLIPALLGVALLGGCAAGPVPPFTATAPVDATSSIPSAASPASGGAAPSPLAALSEEVSPLAPADRTEHPVPSRLAAVPGIVMVESAADREANHRQQVALHRMITKRDSIVGDVVESR